MKFLLATNKPLDKNRGKGESMYRTLKKALSLTLAVATGIPAVLAGTFTFAPIAWAAPSTLTIPISEDATVIELPNSGVNGTTLRVQSSLANQRTVVKVTDFSALPANATVLDADLVLDSVDGPATDRTYNLHQLTAAWTEDEVTWSTVSGAVGSLSDSQVVGSEFLGAKSWDVKNDVIGFLAAPATYNGWVLKDSAEGNITPVFTDWASSEYDTNPDLQPRLVIQYNTPPAAAVLTLPANNGWSNASEMRKPLFQWNASVDAQDDPLAYHLQVTKVDDPTFATPIINVQETLVGQAMTTAAGVVSYQATTALIEGQQYIWQVRASDDPTQWGSAQHAGVFSSVFSFQIDTLSPVAPILSARTGQVELNWTGASDATSGIRDYSVLRSIGGAGFETVLTGETGTRYVESALTSEGQHAYRVRAFDKAGNSIDSDALLAWHDLTAPTSTLTGPTITNNRTVNLTWTATDKGIGVKNVELFVIKEGGAWQSAGAFTASPIAYTGASDGQYGFYIIALDLANNRQVTPLAAQVTTTIDTVAPERPIILTVTENDAQVLLTWQPIGGVDHFDVMYGTSSGVYDFSVQLAGNVTSAKIVGLQNGKQYFFAVAAYDKAGNKMSSAERSGVPVSATAASELDAIGGGVSDFVPPALAARPEGEASLEVKPTEVAIAGAQTEPAATNWTRILVTLGIIAIAIGAAVGGYYGYGWWMRGETVGQKSAPIPPAVTRGRGRPRKDMPPRNDPPSRW
jgi:hypothetical protein